MLYLIGLVSLSLGLLMIYRIRRRQFRRRNAFGVPVFSGYGASIRIRLIEGLIRLIAIALIIAGLIACFLAYDHQRMLEQSQQVRRRIKKQAGISRKAPWHSLGLY